MLHESINLNKYISHIKSLYWNLSYMIQDNIGLNNIIEIKRDKKTKDIIAVVIKAKTEVNKRFAWKNGQKGKVVGELTCKEILEPIEDNMFKRTYFSFHFEAEASSDVKTFRVDYKPLQETPLHAHWYKNMDEHLTYPHETLLELSQIDFCTMMLVISYYIKNMDKYPITNGIDYNNRIINKRRRYDDAHRKH